MSPTRSTAAMLHSGVECQPQYLTGIDVLIGHAGSSCALVFPRGLDPHAMGLSLQKVLAFYPVFSSRYKRDRHGYVFISGQDDGLPFSVVAHAEPMPVWGNENPMGRFLTRHSRRIYPWSLVDRANAPMTIDLHTFGCGGSLLVITASHSMCDGSAFWSFMMDWARCHGGHPVTPAVLDRNSLIEKAASTTATPPPNAWLLRDCSLTERVPLYAGLAWQYLTSLDDLHLHINGPTLSAWQQQAAEAHPDDAPFSSNELAVAWVLRALSASMPAEKMRSVGMVLDLRHRTGLGIARKYVGNALGRDLLELTAHDLSHADVAQVAVRCRLSFDRISVQEQLSHFALLEQYRQQRKIHRLVPEIAVRSLGMAVLVNNCAHFPIYKLDFGSGPPSWHERVGVPYRRVLLSPTAKRDGGLDLHITAKRNELKALAEHAARWAHQ